MKASFAQPDLLGFFGCHGIAGCALLLGSIGFEATPRTCTSTTGLLILQVLSLAFPPDPNCFQRVIKN